MTYDNFRVAEARYLTTYLGSATTMILCDIEVIGFRKYNW